MKLTSGGDAFALSRAYNSVMAPYVLLLIVVVLPFGGCFQFIDCGIDKWDVRGYDVMGKSRCPPRKKYPHLKINIRLFRQVIEKWMHFSGSTTEDGNFLRNISPCETEEGGSKMGHFTEITVTDCDPPNMAYCKLSRGQNATLTINFVPNSDLYNATAVVHGILGGVPIPFDIPNPDGCKDSGLQCPLKANERYTYIATLPVLHSYPKVKVTVKWELQSEDKESIICFELPAKLS